MKLLLDFPTIGEPHYAQALPASLIKDRQLKMYSLAENKDPYVARNEKATRVERKGNVVHVKLTSIRSHFVPDNIEGVQVGDTVYFHVTNLEQDWDVPHGFAITGHEQLRASDDARPDAHHRLDAQTGRGLPVLLHRLLLGAPPGDAGVRPGLTGRLEDRAQVEQPKL